MESITAARNISGLEPMSVLHGIAPLCVPMSVSGDFADEVGIRAVPRIVSLWERLGLFYMLEQPQTAPVSNTRVTVNNFTAQMVFRLCSFSHADRLIERYQPGSVFPENIRSVSQENVRMIRSAEMRRVFRAFTENSRYTEEVSRVFRLIFEKETGGIPLQTVCRALAALLGSSGGGAVFTAQQRRIFERIAAVLGSEYPESPAAVEISRLGAASGFTEEQRARILSAVGRTGNRQQTDAAQMVVQLAERGKSAVEAAELIRSEVRSYGFTDRHYDRESIREMIGTVPGRIAPAGGSAAFLAADPESTAARNGAVRPADGGVYEMAALLYQEPSGTGSGEPAGETDNPTSQRNAEFRRLSGKMTAGISAVFSDILNSAQYSLNNPRYQAVRGIPDRIFRESVLGKADYANAGSGKPGGTGIPGAQGVPGTSERSEKTEYADALNSTSGITMKLYADSPAGRLLERISDGRFNSEFRHGISRYFQQLEFPVSEPFMDARLNAGAKIDSGEKTRFSESGEARVVPMNNANAPQSAIQTLTLPEQASNNYNAEEAGADSVSLWSSFEKSVEGCLTSLFSEISRNINSSGKKVVLSVSDAHSETMRTVQNQVCITAPALRRILSKFSFETDIHSAAFHSNSDTVLTSAVNETAELLRRYSFEENRHQNSQESHVYQDYSFREINAFSEQNTVQNSSTALTFNNAVQKENAADPAPPTAETANHFTGTVLPPEPQRNAAEPEQLTFPERSTAETANHFTGTVLPPEPQRKAAEPEQLTFPERSTAETANPLTGSALPPEPQNNAAEPEHLTLQERSTAETANHLTGTVLPPEPPSNAAEPEQLTLPEHSTAETANHFTGTVLPPEPQSKAAEPEQLTPPTQSETQSNERRTTGSYRDRLDNQTLSVIDQLIAESRLPVPAPEVKKAAPAPEPELNYISSEKSVESRDVIRSVNIVRESMVRHTESHMSRLIERASRNLLPEQPEKKSFTFRTAENTENMVMLVPPTEMDRYRAQQPYMNSLPPIELKEPQPAQSPAETSRTVTTNRQVTVNTSVDGTISSLTREEISRLTDKVYERIETRLARERRRMGL